MAMPDARRIFGTEGEALAEAYLKRKNYQIVDRQQRTPFGEIDLVCLQGREVVFVEVKARHDHQFGYPEDSVHREKIGHLVASAEYLLGAYHWLDRPWRIDVIAIEYHVSPPRIRHIEAIDTA